MSASKLTVTAVLNKTQVTLKVGDWDLTGAVETDGENNLVTLFLSGVKMGEHNNTLGNFNYNLVGENESFNFNGARRDNAVLKAIDAELDILRPVND